MQDLQKTLHNIHLNRFAGLFAVASSQTWKRRHPEVASVRGRIDQLVRLVGSGGSFDTQRFLSEWTRLLLDIINADASLFYAPEDLDWLVTTLDVGYDHARLAIVLLLSRASSRPRWFTCEQLEESTGLTAGAWRKRATAGGNPWQVVTKGKTHLFNELILLAHGIALPQTVEAWGDDLEEGAPGTEPSEEA